MVNQTHGPGTKCPDAGGSSGSATETSSKSAYLLCDAIVETGKTLEENNLEIWKVVLDHGEITIGLYMSSMI